MNCNAQIKIEKQDILLENDVFLYKIPSGLHPEHCHKAKYWNISNPIGRYKLLVLTDDDSDSCHIQLKDDNGNFFGYGVIDCYPGLSGSTLSSSISPVADSSRYFSTKIRRLSSGQDELFGIGFISREDSSSFTKTLENYFTSGKQMPVPTYNAAESSAPAVYNKVPSELFQGKTLQYDYEFCSNSFDTTQLFKEHIETRHTNKAPEILFYCDTEDCGKRFFSQLKLNIHKRTEHVEKNPPNFDNAPEVVVSQQQYQTRCHKCEQIGHWRSECPNKQSWSVKKEFYKNNPEKKTALNRKKNGKKKENRKADPEKKAERNRKKNANKKKKRQGGANPPTRGLSGREYMCPRPATQRTSDQ